MKSSLRSTIQIILELSKIKITVAVALTTAAGYVLSARSIHAAVIFPVSGIFFLACGSSVINHLQERKTDRKMNRTRNRPLPDGRVSVMTAVFIAMTEIATGSIILIVFPGLRVFLLAMFALIWYNLVYTPLKKRTIHAVIPGSLIGAIPPLAGWVAAGGELSDRRALFLAIFFFLWQVPHFYLLALRYDSDYKKGGFPSLTEKYHNHQIYRMIFFWVAGTAGSAMLIPVFEVTRSLITLAGIGILSLKLVYGFLTPFIRSDQNFNPNRYFMKINYYVLLIVLLLIADPYLAIILQGLTV